MSSPSPRRSIESDRSPNSPSAQRHAFPFPTFDARARQPSATRHRTRRGSTASTLSAGSVGGSLDTQSWRGPAVRETSHNAISTLLQPPIVRTGLIPHTQASAAAAGYKAPTTKDIPPVTLTNIPHVPPDTFRDYLNRVGPLFESFQRGRAEPEQPQWLKKDKELEKTDRLAEALERRVSGSVPTVSSPALSRQSSMTNLSPAERPDFPRRRSSLGLRRNRNEPTPLSTIPNIYFDEDFHLENPRIFDVVSERAEIVRSPPGSETVESKPQNGTPLAPRKALVTNAILQEKLSWYMDTVEVHLISNISNASNGFFAALGSLKELQLEAEESVAKIQRLREDLRRLDQDVALSGLAVAAKKRRRENVRKLGKATAQVQSVVENIQRADSLVDEGAYDRALDQMDKVGRLICGQQEPGSEHAELMDLRPLKALQGLDSGLQELQLRIGTGFAQGFTAVLIEDIRRHVEKVDPTDTLKRWSRQRGIPHSYMETSEEFRRSLEAYLHGMARAGHTAPATAAYRESVQREMKILIKKHLPSSSDDDADSMISTSTRGGTKLSQQEKSSILARNLRSLGAEDAEALFIKIYTSVGEALRRISTQTKILLDITSNMETPGSPPSPTLASGDEHLSNGADGSSPKTVQEELSQALDMSSLLGQAVDTAQTQITKILKVRNEQSVRLSKEYFLRYFNINRLFADECEGISGRGGNVLKGVINAQITGFIQVLGTAETERVANLLDSEGWNAEDFSDDHNEILQRVLGAMSRDPPEWTQGAGPIWEPFGGQTDSGTRIIDTTQVPNGTSTPASRPQVKPAYIDDTRFILVPSATSLLPTIDTFLSLTAAFPSMTPQISTSLLDVLRTFNSRSCQLILGAGAIRSRSAGLKNITTKHLALASQALSFLVALTPYTRECVRRHVPTGQTAVLAEFDKTKRLYQDHQAGIHDKLVDIITSRSQAHVKALHALDLDDNNKEDATAPGKGAEGVSAYMETLTKETLTLHRVLVRHLSEVDVGMVMRQIATSYREQWTEAFAEADPKTPRGEARLLRDAEMFAAKLGRIEGFAEIGDEVLARARAATRAKVAVEGKVSAEVEVEEGKGRQAAKGTEAKEDDEEEEISKK